MYKSTLSQIPKICFILVFLIIMPAYSWDNTGHKLIATIAYQHLQPTVQSQIDQLTKLLDPNHTALQRFLYDSIWLDTLPKNSKGKKPYGSWHFINLPYSVDHSLNQKPKRKNLLWALQKEQRILQSSYAKPQQKALALRFIIHLAGDAHQPLHCISLFSQRFPHGDAGGNFYIIDDLYVANLHAYWDEGVGLFRSYGLHYPLSSKNVHHLAQQIEDEYPLHYFGQTAIDLNFQTWINQSYQLAKDFVYTTPEDTCPNWRYNQEGRKIVKQQIALAGYRLAALLNSVFTGSVK